MIVGIVCIMIYKCCLSVTLNTSIQPTLRYQGCQMIIHCPCKRTLTRVLFCRPTFMHRIAELEWNRLPICKYVSFVFVHPFTWIVGFVQFTCVRVESMGQWTSNSSIQRDDTNLDLYSLHITVGVFLVLCCPIHQEVSRQDRPTDRARKTKHLTVILRTYSFESY